MGEERLRERPSTGRGTFVPLAFRPGEAFQFDRSEDWGALPGGARTKLQVAYIELSHSRACLLRAYLSPPHAMQFDARWHGFRVCGGVPGRGIYDNMKTAVERIVMAAEGQILCEHEQVIQRPHHLSPRMNCDWRHDLAIIQRKTGAPRNGAAFAGLPVACRQLQKVVLCCPGGGGKVVDILRSFCAKMSSSCSGLSRWP